MGVRVLSSSDPRRKGGIGATGGPDKDEVELDECDRVMALMGSFKRPLGEAVKGDPVWTEVVCESIATLSLGGVAAGTECCVDISGRVVPGASVLG